MGGSNRSRRQETAQDTSGAAAATERQRAGELQTNLEGRRDIVGSGLPETQETTRAGAANLRDTGGLGPETEGINAGYKDLAATGGFSPEDKTNFLRRASSPIAAMYGRTKDELNRRLSIQGGYMPGYGASANKLQRSAAQQGAEATLGANVELANQVRQGKTAGLAGQTDLAKAAQQGRIAGQDALQRYTQYGASALSDIDVNELRNRLQSGQLSQADSALLAQLAAQDKTTFDKVMQGITAVGGAVAGVAGAVK